MSNTPSIMQPRNFYKPFDYPWAHEMWKHHEAQHWMGYEVSFGPDVADWENKLSESEKNLLTHLFRFFTQADVDVAEGYSKLFVPYFAHKPELAMMMNSFAAREAVHVDAYALLLETVGMPETTYQQFHEYKEMKDKHEFVMNCNMDDTYEVLKSLAIYSGFTEGMQLFASFAVLLNFQRDNKMKNMGNIVAWSIRDESMHVEGMTRLFTEYLEDHRDQIDYEKLVQEVKTSALKMVELEDRFIDLIYSDSSSVSNLDKEDVKAYIRYISNIRWHQLSFTESHGPLFEGNLKNPLPWVDYLVFGEEHTNFFEGKSTSYGKAMTTGTLDEVEW